MEFFKWKDSFNIGHALIDRQHRSFLGMLNEYYEAISSGEIGPAGKNLVDELRSYAAMHFRAEEDLMESVAYEKIEQHRKQHKYFESLVSDLKKDHIEEKAESVKKALPFMKDWFLNHILEQDKEVAPYLESVE